MTVRVYLFEQEIDGSKYGGELCARDLGEAQDLALLIGAKVLGTSERQECQECGACLREGSQVLGDNEWPNEINA